MAEFPYYTERTIPGQSGSVRGSLDTSVGGQQLAQSYSRLGQAVYDVGEMFYVKQANTQFSESQRLANEAINKRNIELNNNTDPDAYDKIHEKYIAEINKLIPKNRRAAQAYSLWLNQKSPQWQEDVITQKQRRIDDNYIAESMKQIASVEDNPTPENIKMAQSHIDRGKQIGMDATKMFQLDAGLKNAAKTGFMSKSYSDAIVPGVTKGWNLETKQEGYDIINANENLTDEEKRVVLNRFDSRYSGEITKQAKNKYIENEKITQALTVKLLNKELNADEIASLNLDKKMQEKWLGKDNEGGYLRQSYGEPPAETTPGGFETIMEVVRQSNRGQITKVEAYDKILTARYTDGYVTDSDANWALSRIEKPYKPQVLDVMEDAIKQNVEMIREEESPNVWWNPYTSAEERRVTKKSQQITEKLIRWVDSELAINPDRVFTPKEMLEMKAEIAVTTKPNTTDEPQTYEDFRRQVSILKKIDAKTAREYYDKWADKW